MIFQKQAAKHDRLAGKRRITGQDRPVFLHTKKQRIPVRMRCLMRRFACFYA